VRAGVPFHGRNQYPEAVPALGPVVREYMARMTALGHAVMRGLALSLNLPPNFFREAFSSDPFTPFRLFNYPAPVRGVGGVGGSVADIEGGIVINAHERVPSLMLAGRWCRRLGSTASDGALASIPTMGCSRFCFRYVWRHWVHGAAQHLRLSVHGSGAVADPVLDLVLTATPCQLLQQIPLARGRMPHWQILTAMVLLTQW
jgi:hypothetical protein